MLCRESGRRRSSRSISGSRSKSRDRAKHQITKEKKVVVEEKVELKQEDLEGKTEDEVELMKAMGFCTFDTSKGKRIEGNDVSAVHHVVKRKYRQYMNRRGGFNRPLDFVN